MKARLPTNPLLSLADELLAALPSLMKEHPAGPGLPAIAKRLGADRVSVRNAMHRLNSDGRADLWQRPTSRRQFLVPLKYGRACGFRICANCGTAFELAPVKRHKAGPYYSNRRTCTRACGIAWSWTRPGVRELRRAGIAAQKRTPKALAKTAAFNKERWSRPGERERMSQQNRRRWADPATKADLTRAIRISNGSPKARLRASETKKRQWQEPDYREKTVAGIRRSKSTPEARAKFSKLLSARWQDPEWRKKYLAATRRNAKKATAANVGKRQSAEHVARRVKSRRAANHQAMA